MCVLEISQLSLRYAETRIRRGSWRARLAAAIAQEGQLSPVLVHRDGEQFVLVDGYARVDALRELGRDHVDALVLEMSAAEALLTRHRLQGGRRPTAIEEGWLLRILVDDHGLRPRDLAAKLERSASWVSRRLALVEVLPDKAQAAVRRSELCPQAAMKSLVPLARANAEHCERLVDALAGQFSSARDLDHIYRAWRAADASVRERIVNAPLLFLRAARAAAPECGDAPRPVVEHLVELRKVTERVADLLLVPRPPQELDLLRDEWTRACRALDVLASRMDNSHEGRRNPPNRSPTQQDGGPQSGHLADPPDIAQHGSLHPWQRGGGGSSAATANQPG